MSERDSLERAKKYMETLANGINPLDGSQIPDDEVVNNVHLSRYFFYVADVLRQVIENGGISQQKKGKKIPFNLPVENRNAFAFSNKPIPVSVIAERINHLIVNENMKKLPYRAIRDWLLSIEMLEEELNGDGKLTRRPTSQGENMGITLESRMGQNGTYFVVVYDLNAQHFIMDNLDAIVDYEHDKMENQGKPWLPDHDMCLRDLYAKGVPVPEIAVTLKRNSGAIRARLKKLSLTE